MLVPTFRSLSVSSVVVHWSLRTTYWQHLWLYLAGPVSPSASLVSLARRHSNIHSVTLKCTLSSYPVCITFGIKSGKKKKEKKSLLISPAFITFIALFLLNSLQKQTHSKPGYVHHFGPLAYITNMDQQWYNKCIPQRSGLMPKWRGIVRCCSKSQKLNLAQQ